MVDVPEAPSPSARKAAKRAANGEPREPSTPAQLQGAPAKVPAKLDVTYTLRPEDKYLNLKFHYPNDVHKFVIKQDCEDLLNVFTAMQREDLIKLHTAERYKLGEIKVKEVNPDFKYFQGYGNKKSVVEETLPAARCVEVTLERLATHASHLINNINLTSKPLRKGNPPIVYDNDVAFMAYINSLPDQSDADDDDIAADPTWKAQVESRLKALEDLAKLPALVDD